MACDAYVKTAAATAASGSGSYDENQRTALTQSIVCERSSVAETLSQRCNFHATWP